MKAVYLCKKNQNFAYFLVFTKNSSSVLPLEAFLFFYFPHFFPGDLRLRIIENLPKPFGFFRKLIKTIDFSSCSTIWKSSFFYKKYENHRFLLLKTMLFFLYFWIYLKNSTLGACRILIENIKFLVDAFKKRTWKLKIINDFS